MNLTKKSYYIFAAAYIFPQSKSLLQNYSTEISGFMLDTTWRIFSGYVTSILTGCFLNTSVPIAFAIGHSECKSLYDFLLLNVQKETGFDFHSKTFLSDQGSDLKGLFKDYSIKHLYCLKHFLTSMQYNDYSYEIGILVRCSSDFELTNAKSQCAQKFTHIVKISK